MPWVRRVDHARVAIAGPDALCLRTPVEMHGEDMTTVSEFTLEPGERIPFVLTWFPSHEPLPDAIDPEAALADTEEYWLDWAAGCGHHGDYHEEIHQSLLLLKALTYAPTGGIVAAPTTSLPEWIGGVRNWDYRYCWLRDATLTLLAMLNAGLQRRGDGVAAVAAARGRGRSRPTSRSCTASRASGGSTSASSTGCPGSRGRARCGSATPPRSSSSSTSTAR